MMATSVSKPVQSQLLKTIIIVKLIFTCNQESTKHVHHNCHIKLPVNYAILTLIIKHN